MKKHMKTIKGLLSIPVLCLMVFYLQAANTDAYATNKAYYEELHKSYLGLLMENGNEIIPAISSENMLESIAVLSGQGTYKWRYQLDPSLFVPESAITDNNMNGYTILGRESQDKDYKVILLDGDGMPINTTFLESKAFAAVATAAGCYYVLPDDSGINNQLYFADCAGSLRKLVHTFDFTVSGVYLLHHSEQLDVIKIHYYEGTDGHWENTQALLLGIDSSNEVTFQYGLGHDVWGANHVSENGLCPNNEGGITFIRNQTYDNKYNPILITAIDMHGNVLWENEVSGSYYSLLTMLFLQDVDGYYELWGQTSASQMQNPEACNLFHLKLQSDGSYVSDEIKSLFNPEAVYCKDGGTVYIASFDEEEGKIVRRPFQDFSMDISNTLTVKMK